MLKVLKSHSFLFLLNSIILYVFLFLSMGARASAEFGPGSDNFGTDENGSASVAYGGYMAEAYGYADSDADGNGGEDAGFGQMGIDGGFSAEPGGVGGGLYGGGGDTYGGGGEALGGGVYGGSGTGTLSGDPGTDTLGQSGPNGGPYGPSMTEQMISSSISTAVEHEELYGPTKESITRNVNTELKDEIDHFNSLANPTADDIFGIGEAIDAEVAEQIGNLAFLSGGVTTGTINLWEYTVDEKSASLLRHLLVSLHKADMIDPLTLLGLKGINMVVMADLPNSFYARDLDTVYVARRDVQNYGAVVVYHELLHAGLDKAKASGAISEEEFNELSELSETYFSDLDGYAGSSKGLYERDGYGYQEAFAVGWSFFKLKKNYVKLPENMQPRAENYMIDVLDNIVIAQTPDGQNIRMVSSTLTNHDEVKDAFTQVFEGNSEVRSRILEVQQKIRSQLPELCTPGEWRRANQVACPEKSERPVAYDLQTCRNNYRFETVSNVTCGVQVRDGVSGIATIQKTRLYSPLPDLCTPGEERRADIKVCDGNWSRSHSYKVQRCAFDFKFRTIESVDCGYWSR